MTSPPATATRATDAGTAARRAPAGPSTIMLKVAMSMSGVVLFGFVFIHMVGNLKVYVGPESIDRYAAWLLDVLYPFFPEEGLLWTLRVVLGVAVVVHVWAASVLARRNRRATGGARRRPRSYTARTMPLTGVAITLFVILHVLDLTVGTANPEFVRGAVYDNIVASFSRPLVAVIYLAAMLLLGSHLLHGLWSAFTSLGATGHRIRRVGRYLAVGTAGLVVAGNASIPIAVQLGIVS